MSDKSSVKWCIACAKNNVNSKLKLFQISFREAVFLCSKQDCIGDPAQFAYVDRQIEELRRKPRIKDKKKGSSLKSSCPKTESVSSSPLTVLNVVSHAPSQSQNINVEDSNLPTPVLSNPSEPENDTLSLSFLSDKEFWDSFETSEAAAKQPGNVLGEFDSICADLLSGLPDVEYTDTTLVDTELNILGKRFESTPEVGLTPENSLNIHSVNKVASEGVHTSRDLDSLLQTDTLLIDTCPKESLVPDVQSIDSFDCNLFCQTLETNALPLYNYSEGSTAPYALLLDSADCTVYSDGLQTDGLLIAKSSKDSITPEVNLVDSSVSASCCVSGDTLQTDVLPIASSSGGSAAPEVNLVNVPVSADCRDTLQTDALPIVNIAKSSNAQEVKFLDPSTNHCVDSKTLQMKASNVAINPVSSTAQEVYSQEALTASSSNPNQPIVSCKSSTVSGSIRTYTRIRKATAVPCVLPLSSSMHKQSQADAVSDTNAIQQTCLSGSEVTTTLLNKTKNSWNVTQRQNNTLVSNTIYSSFVSAANQTGITNFYHNKEAQNNKSPNHLKVTQTHNNFLVNNSNCSSFVTAASQSGGQNTNHKRKASARITSNSNFVRKTSTRKPRVNNGPIIPHKSYILQRFLTSIDKQEVVNTSRPAETSTNSPVHPFANIDQAVRPQPQPFGLFENSLVSSPGKINCDKSSGISSDVSRTDSLGPSYRRDILPLTRKPRLSATKRKKPPCSKSSEPEVELPQEATSFKFSAMKKDLCVKYIKLGEIDKLLALNEKRKAANLLKKQPPVKSYVKKKTSKTLSS